MFLDPRRRIEATYRKALYHINKLMQKHIKGITDPNKIISTLKKISKMAEFNKFAESTALKMVTQLFYANAKSWREAARKSSKGRIIYLALKEESKGIVGQSVKFQIKENAKLIKSLPLDVAERVTGYIKKESEKGKRASEIAEEIQKMFPHNSKAKANLIARTEVSKVTTALTRARSEEIGLDWYIWRTSEDERVRSSHEIMEDVLIKWTNPPSPEKLIGKKSYGNYHAGDFINCRCYPEPVIDINNIKFPHKVYYKNKIQMMTLAQFKKIA